MNKNQQTENRITVEICIDSVSSAVAAEKGGADRVELCANLTQGGTTPSSGMMKTVKAAVSIPVHVIIRPRGGDFLYSQEEVAVMLADIRTAGELGISGVVIGALTPEGDIDLSSVADMVKAAKGMSITFHRAFDMCRDPHRGIGQLIEMGIDRILTSGQQPSAEKGIPLLRELNRQYGQKISIMPGAGIRAFNARNLITETGVKEIHASAGSMSESKMLYRNESCFMGSPQESEYELKATDAAKVRELVGSVE